MNKTVNFIRKTLLPLIIIALVLWVYISRGTAGQTTASPAENITQTQAADVVKGESYTDAQSVAKYIDAYGELPPNYITKSEAEALGWDSRDGNLDEVAPGKSIGGDRYGNYEGTLPKGSWHECDINYTGGYREAERLIFTYDGQYYYTNDHYKTFTEITV